MPTAFNINRKQRGMEGEQRVVDLLRQEGFTIAERNFRTRLGEIDIIARKKELLVFVEVKLRNADHVPIAQMIPPSKQRTISAVAKNYISFHTHHHTDVVYRFDVALVMPRHGDYDIVYLPNAFEGHE